MGDLSHQLEVSTLRSSSRFLDTSSFCFFFFTPWSYNLSVISETATATAAARMSY
jgi:hypothetical protein